MGETRGNIVQRKVYVRSEVTWCDKKNRSLSFNIDSFEARFVIGIQLEIG